MPFVVIDRSTGNYLTSSRSEKVDTLNIVYARVYPTKKGADSAARYYQNLNMHFYNVEQINLNSPGGPHKSFEQRYFAEPNWVVDSRE
jgi:hypothetical protein